MKLCVINFRKCDFIEIGVACILGAIVVLGILITHYF